MSIKSDNELTEAEKKEGKKTSFLLGASFLIMGMFSVTSVLIVERILKWLAS